MGAFKTIDHVVTSAGIGRSAWFRDTDGNDRAVPTGMKPAQTVRRSPPMREGRLAIDATETNTMRLDPTRANAPSWESWRRRDYAGAPVAHSIANDRRTHRVSAGDWAGGRPRPSTPSERALR
jgi:hypothetical protein